MPKTNNFDLIRLAAALQVAIHHSMVHLDVEYAGGWFFGLFRVFPGVPIFFFISGFLISTSFERNQNLVSYTLNRVLRIYPALIACFVMSVLAVWISGYFASTDVSVSEFLRWSIAQLTIVQFYNPQFLRGYGVGVLNGSLWTIAVELQFYVVLPLLYAFLKLLQHSANSFNRVLLALTVLFLLANQSYVWLAGQRADDFIVKLAGVTFIPWVYMFLVGVFAQRNFIRLHSWLGGHFIVVFLVYCVAAVASQRLLGWSFGNTLNPVVFLALAAVTFSAAFTGRSLSDRILFRNDISYGVYIYHMPVVNYLVAMKYSGSLLALFAAIATTVVFAFISWRWVEKPALRLKKHALYQHQPLPIVKS